MNTEIKIESGIPLPKKSVGARVRKYPLRNMNVGDSITIEGGVKEFASATGNASFVGRSTGWKFATRRIKEGGKNILRIWRVE
jgi:hypothetical protein